MYRRAVKVRIYPNKEQKVFFSKCFGCDRWIFNKSLNLKQEKYKENKENLSWIKISKMVTEWKQTEEFSWLNEVPRCLFEQSLKKLDKSYANFFKHGFGFPNFKKKQNTQSFTVSDPTRIVGNKIRLPKMELMPVRGLRKFDGDIKNVTVTKNKANQYFASWSVEDVIEIQKTQGTKTVGIDVNLENFLTDSEGNRVENPRFKKQKVHKIEHLQRNLSRCKPDSKNKEKKRIKLAKVFNKIDNKKKDFLHKLSNNYVKNHDVIVVEELKIKNMVKNHCLAESISNVAWGEFFRQLEYKCLWNGKTFVKVDPKFTSKTCHVCNVVNDELKLSDRSWACKSCGATHVRDENAAKNIKIRAEARPIKACGASSDVLKQVVSI